MFLTERVGVGYEYREKPDNLGAFREQAFQDAFVAWLPNKHVAATVAYTRLGTIANQRDQRGLYLSGQVSD